jgi:hypothetical protein
MAHYAKLTESNIVKEVLVVNNDVITIDGNESEQAGIDFLTNLTGYPNWKQTSYNGNFRGKFASIGCSYLPLLDIFIEPKPYASWTLNEDKKIWEAPNPKPTDGKEYDWFESNQQWVEVDND